MDNNELQNILYAALIGPLEEIEHGKRVVGNGHHLAQTIIADVIKRVEARRAVAAMFPGVPLVVDPTMTEADGVRLVKSDPDEIPEFMAAAMIRASGG
jgi:hypothetical protein